MPCTTISERMMRRILIELRIQQYDSRLKTFNICTCTCTLIISTHLWKLGELLQVWVAPIDVAMPPGGMPARKQVHAFALIGVGHDPPPYPRDHGNHVATAVEVCLGNHLSYRARSNGSITDISERAG